jgi:hypothetical protein
MATYIFRMEISITNENEIYLSPIISKKLLDFLPLTLNNMGKMRSPQAVKIACQLFAVVLANIVACPAAITVKNIAQGCAANHSLFLKSDGSLQI